MSPRVSIIIPVYNVEQYVEECLQSVVNQTVTESIECIVVDDRGTDNSMEVVRKYIDSLLPGKKDIFKIITRDTNGGLSAARNSGITEAKGEYLYFLDSDDYLIPNAIELLLSLADKYGGIDLIPALYKTDDGRMDHFNKDAFPKYSEDRVQIKRTLLDYDKLPVTAANRLIKRQLIVDNELYFKEGIIHEDNHWTFFLAKHVTKMGLLAEKIYYYRLTPGSIMTASKKEKEIISFRTIIEDCIANIDEFESGSQKREIFLYILMMVNNGYYNNIGERNGLIRLLASKSSLIERILLYFVFYFSFGNLINTKLINLIQKIYLR